ncbi:BrnT family toxin [uncultured Sphingomonas sp.]|uniref:BrnT family toxin n=1 Tax=uncultured Sphingomonas sp. TaxID=158754 RepID=UPI0035CC49EB
MDLLYDPAKDVINRFKHGLSFQDFHGFDAEPTVTVDNRFDYGERRFRAFGRISGVPHCLVYTETGAGVRAISFRRVHGKEFRRYE